MTARKRVAWALLQVQGGCGGARAKEGRATIMSSDDRKSGGKQKWTPPGIKLVGDVGEVLQHGSGKLSTSPGDPGEPRKPSGGGGEP